MGTDVPAKPVFLGYPHGPKTSEFVPAGRMARTYEIRVKGPLDADVRASADSFACNDRVESVLGSVYGHPSSGADNGIYDRKDDWLLTVDSGVVSAVKNGHYRVHFGAGESVIRIRPSYYRNHLGYFLWDNSRSNWKTPVAGWCSWMAHLQGVTEKNVVDAAKFFSANLKDYGYGIIQIDDGYQRVSQFPDGDVAVKEPFAHYWTIPNEKFPSGLKSLASTISGLGMTPGIWVGDYLPAGLNHKEGYVQDADGKPHKGPWVNYAMNGNDAAAIDEAYVNTVRELRADGWRYFKIDTLRHVLYDSYRQVPEYWQKRGESMEEAYRKILASTKKAAGADNYLLACWGTIPELAGIPDGARIGEDVGPDVASMRRSAKYIAQFQHLNDVVWRNDPDYMCLRVPVAQAQAWATLTFLAGGHVMVSDPISDYDASRLDVLRRVGPPLVTRPSSVVPHGPDPEFMTLRAEKDGEHDAWRLGKIHQLLGTDALDEIVDAGRIVGGDGRAFFQRFMPDRAKLLHRFFKRVGEVIVGREIKRSQRHIHSSRLGEEAGGADGFQSHARIFIGRLHLEQRERVAHTIAPVAENACRSGAGVRIRRTQNPLKQILIDHVHPLMHPERFGDMMLVGGVVLIETFDPFARGGGDFGGIMFAEFDLGKRAHLIFGGFKKIEQSSNGLAVDFGLMDQIAAFIGDAVNSAMEMIAIRIAEMVLKVADDGVGPIHEVNRAVRADAYAGRAEGVVFR